MNVPGIQYQQNENIIEMRILTILVMALLSTIRVSAGRRPEVVPSKLSELRSIDWYQKTRDSWLEFLDDNPNDKNGWLEYFKASRFANVQEDKLLNIKEKINTLFPDSREDHYVNFRTLGWTNEGMESLKEAIALDDGQHSFLAEEIMLSVATGHSAKKHDLVHELFMSGAVYPSLLNYSYNVLMSTGEEGILIVEGEHSTIPLWVLQDVMGVRRDVKVLNLDIATNPEFLSRWLNEHALTGPTGAIQKSAIIRELPLANKEKGFYYALTLSNKDLLPVEKRLYVVGLASMHTEEAFDNYQILKRNVEQKFLMDYLTVDFNGEPKTATGKVYETNYIVPFLLLKEYYDEIGDQVNSDLWRSQILEVAQRSDLKERVERLLSKSENEAKPNVFKVVEIPVKVFDKRMKPFKDNLYVADSEVNNKDYWFYLDYLHKNGYQELYRESVVDRSKYDPVTASFLDNYHYSPTNAEAQKSKADKNYMKRYNDYPAMDMTYDAANAYCDWLSFQYNNQPTRKYKKVKFRLPERKEWIMAALGYKNFQSWELSQNKIKAQTRDGRKKSSGEYDLGQYVIDYPWGLANFDFRNKIRNEHECYLANIKASDEVSCPAGIKGDGFTLTSPIMTYFPNNLGLFDVIGNVAEMTNVDGIAMGGSWNHQPEESTIKSINEYEGSDISVGFRLFMEVIEE